jgi:hypothetical protein
MVAYSQPITPAPTIARRRGMCAMRRMVSLS